MNAEKPNELQILKQTAALKTYIAFDEARNEKVIVKEVSLDGPQAFLNAFEMEVRVLQALQSPWMPALIDQGYARGTVWFSETFLQGVPLGDWLKKKPSRKEKKDVFIQIVRLIETVHQAGYLYLDLKLDNILIHHGHAVLIDFNAALPIGSSRPILASKESLPPEGADGRTMDEAADQIGLGRLYLSMFGPSVLSWTALSKDPRRRFKSLRDFEAAVRKEGRRKAVLVGAALALLLVAGTPFLVKGFAMRTQSAEKTAHPLAKKAEGLRAAEYCLRFEEAERSAQPGSIRPMEWQSAADAALGENHRPLAGYLLDHLPEDDTYSIRFTACLLQLLCEQSLSQSVLEELIRKCPDQTGWDAHLSRLFTILSARNVALSRECLESLFHSLAGKEDMSVDLCRNALCYLLEMREAGMERITLDEPVAGRFEAKAGAYYLLYTQSEPARKTDQSDRKESTDPLAQTDMPVQ